MKKMLVTIAHPSDEAFVLGGMIAKYSKSGWDIRILTATSGEKGSEIVRQKELQRAGHLLGVSEIKFLGFSGGNLFLLSPGTLEDVFETYMKDMLPDIVVTFGTTGINNDPDHKKMCYATTYAFQKHADYLDALSQHELGAKGRGKMWKQAEFQRAFGNTGIDTKAPKLYYACYPKGVTEYLQKVKRLPFESFGKPWIGTQDKHITTVIDITRQKTVKIKALKCYETQTESVEPFISFSKNPYLTQEYFLLRMQGIYEVFMGKTDRFANAL
jgi:LmbE family N-acetylglucosaminyl deacetylase